MLNSTFLFLEGNLATCNVSAELTSSLRAVILHPLVILHISEHWTRTKVNNPNKPILGIEVNFSLTSTFVSFIHLYFYCIVYGALLGKVNGRNVEVINSFELVVTELEGHVVLDSEFCMKKDSLYRQVFSDLEFVGALLVIIDNYFV